MDNSRKLPDTVALDEQNDKLIIIDQTKLPRKLETIAISSPEDIFDAIKTLKVRGAPAIGVSAAIGYYIIAKNLAKTLSGDALKAELKKQKQYLASSRPTRRQPLLGARQNGTQSRRNRLRKQTSLNRSPPRRMQTNKRRRHSLLPQNRRKRSQNPRRRAPHPHPLQRAVNSPPSATAPHSPPSTSAKNKASTSKSTATKPAPSYRECALAFELAADGIDTTVICDNMPSILMKNGMIDAIIVGADRIAANGDTANKIGTSGLAIIAKTLRRPLLRSRPTLHLDMNTKSGKDIPIEQRDANEIGNLWFSRKPHARKRQSLQPRIRCN